MEAERRGRQFVCVVGCGYLLRSRETGGKQSRERNSTRQAIVLVNVEHGKVDTSKSSVKSILSSGLF